MCRWLAYTGAPILLEDLLFKPDHSLIDQSLEAHSSPSTTNGDGFGVGWYDDRDFPALYHEVRPAWNDRNLRELSAQIRSPMFLAHVRATTGTAIQHTNCHPFRHGQWLFQHNGLIRDFLRLKRELVMAIDPQLFPEVQGTTDSEVMFYLALTFGMQENVVEGLERMVGFVERIGRANDIEHPVQMTLGLSDASKMYAVRYSSEGDSRSLFHSKDVDALRKLAKGPVRFSDDARVIVSEPLTESRDFWTEIPEATIAIVDGAHIVSQPFQPHD